VFIISTNVRPPSSDMKDARTHRHEFVHSMEGGGGG